MSLNISALLHLATSFSVLDRSPQKLISPGSCKETVQQCFTAAGNSTFFPLHLLQVGHRFKHRQIQKTKQRGLQRAFSLQRDL